MFKMWANIQAVMLLLTTSMLMGAVSAIEKTSGKSCVDSTFLTSVYTDDLIWGRPKIESDIDLTSLIFDFNRKYKLLLFGLGFSRHCKDALGGPRTLKRQHWPCAEFSRTRLHDHVQPNRRCSEQYSPRLQDCIHLLRAYIRTRINSSYCYSWR